MRVIFSWAQHDIMGWCPLRTARKGFSGGRRQEDRGQCDQPEQDSGRRVKTGTEGRLWPPTGPPLSNPHVPQALSCYPHTGDGPCTSNRRYRKTLHVFLFFFQTPKKERRSRVEDFMSSWIHQRWIRAPFLLLLAAWITRREFVFKKFCSGLPGCDGSKATVARKATVLARPMEDNNKIHSRCGCLAVRDISWSWAIDQPEERRGRGWKCRCFPALTFDLAKHGGRPPSALCWFLLLFRKFRFGCDLKLDEIDMSLNETPDNLMILFKFVGKESEWAGSLSRTPPTFISLPKKGKHPVPDDTLNSFPEQGRSLDCFLFFSFFLFD